MNYNQSTDVIIIGGGPAGVATSITLTKYGISNCVIDAEVKPRKKIGEAVPPNAKPILKKLGIDHLVEEPEHISYYGNKSCWGSDKFESKEFIRGVYGSGYLLNRKYFEEQLLREIKDTRTPFFPGYKLNTIVKEVHGIKVGIENKNKQLEIEGKYIVDATGRKASVARKLGVYKNNLDTQFALTFTIQVDAIIEQQISVEATENGWWYAAPGERKELILTFFTVKELIPDKGEIEVFLFSELKTSLHLFKLLELPEIKFENLKIMPAGTSYLKIPYGEFWIAVGDAAYSYDPISSYGITSALASGYYAAQALKELLSGNKDALFSYRFIVESAFKTYMEGLIQHYSQEKRWRNSSYWQKRFQNN